VIGGAVVPWLAQGGEPASWRAWSVVLRGAFAERLDEGERALFRRLTDREPPPEPVRELWCCVGRRGGKTATASALVVYYACVHDFSAELRGGEVATIPVIAQDRAAARNLFRYTRDLITRAGFEALVARETADSIELSNGCVIEITTASARSVRGYSMPLIVADEVAHWRASDTSAEPDVEVLEALRPSQATFRRPLLVAISSPHARRGALWETYRRHWGQDGDVLVVRGATREFNPTVPQAEVDRALAGDSAAARANWLAEFRADVESFLSREAVDAATVGGRRELPFRAGVRYFAVADASGGVSDSAALAIAHAEGDVAVLDLVREIPAPHSPGEATRQLAETLKSYRLACVTADRYAAEFVVDAYRRENVSVERSDRSASEFYLELLPAVNSGRVALLDVDRLRTQLLRLERTTARGGKESVSHPPDEHDDVANAAAAALVLATRSMAALGGSPLPTPIGIGRIDLSERFSADGVRGPRTAPPAPRPAPRLRPGAKADPPFRMGEPPEGRPTGKSPCGWCGRWIDDSKAVSGHFDACRLEYLRSADLLLPEGAGR
jgi:hypothetical protein